MSLTTSHGSFGPRRPGSAVLSLLSVMLVPPLVEASERHMEDAIQEMRAGDFPAVQLESVTRTPVVGDVVHYEAVVRLGAGPYDKIGLHRVVRETQPRSPIHTQHSVMLLHGDVSTFETSFLLTAHSNAVPAGHAVAAYLAQHGVDVWGVDRRWTFVPDAAVDFTPLANMGFAVAVDDTRTAMAIARRVRHRTGSGPGRLTLGGWSRGAEISYAVANDEAVRPPIQRHVKALMPVDVPIRYAPEDQAWRQAVCNSYNNSKLQYDAGAYADSSGALAKTAATLDVSMPAGPSPIIPGLTNHQVVLVLLTQSYVLADPVPWFHFAAGTFDMFGLPNGLQYSNYEYIRTWFLQAPAHQARLETLDGYALVCESPALPFDDNLHLVTVPTFYLGAAGGFSIGGLYGPTLLGSSDVTTHVVQLHPDTDKLVDFGHADLMYAGNAPALAWQRLLSFIYTH